MIKFIDFVREHKIIQQEIKQAVNRVFNSGRYVLSTEVKKFEEEFARYCGTKYCVGVNSGTDALYLSLLAAGIGPGDEVIVPVNTAIPCAVAVLMSGARPVFVDCDESFLLDAKQIPALVNKRTKAIMAVHLYGLACDMCQLRQLAQAHKLLLIEDCAQANGALWNNKKVGSWGDFGCFSFYPTKNIGAYGDGGAITTNSKKYYQRLLKLRFYGQKNRVESVMFGVNSRLDELQAAILRVKLKYLDEWNNRRQTIADLYRKLIDNPDIILPAAQEKDGHVYHLFVIRASGRDKLMDFLRRHQVETLIHYPIPLHRQPTFREKAQKTFPRAESYAKQLVSLPLYPFLRDSEIKKISSLINKFSTG